MANRISNTAAGETGNQNDLRTPILLSSHNSKSKENNDDLIVSLAERYENKARQVGEWERLYGQNVYRAV